jgi:hypothetical protein
MGALHGTSDLIKEVQGRCLLLLPREKTIRSTIYEAESTISTDAESVGILIWISQLSELQKILHYL